MSSPTSYLPCALPVEELERCLAVTRSSGIQEEFRQSLAAHLENQTWYNATYLLVEQFFQVAQLHESLDQLLTDKYPEFWPLLPPIVKAQIVCKSQDHALGQG